MSEIGHAADLTNAEDGLSVISTSDAQSAVQSAVPPAEPPAPHDSERTLASVFVACVELLVVAVLGVALMTVIAGLALPPLGGSTVFWVINVTAILTAANLVFHAALASLPKQRTVSSPYHQRAAEAYLGGLVVVLGVSGTMLWVGGSSSAYGPAQERVSHVNGQRYAVSVASDWKQVASGEWKWVQETDGLMHPSMGGRASEAGLAVLAAALGHTLGLLLIGCYMAYSCTPDGGRQRLFLHPTTLLCTNFVVSLILPWSVTENFAKCSDWGTQAGVAGLGLILACVYDRVVNFYLPFLPKNVGQGVVTLAIHAFPLSYVYTTNIPLSVKYIPTVFCVLGAALSLYDIAKGTKARKVAAMPPPAAASDGSNFSAGLRLRSFAPGRRGKWVSPELPKDVYQLIPPLLPLKRRVSQQR